jgi:hypothetical protein
MPSPPFQFFASFSCFKIPPSHAINFLAVYNKMTYCYLWKNMARVWYTSQATMKSKKCLLLTAFRSAFQSFSECLRILLLCFLMSCTRVPTSWNAASRLPLVLQSLEPSAPPAARGSFVIAPRIDRNSQNLLLLCSDCNALPVLCRACKASSLTNPVIRLGPATRPASRPYIIEHWFCWSQLQLQIREDSICPPQRN